MILSLLSFPSPPSALCTGFPRPRSALSCYLPLLVPFPMPSFLWALPIRSVLGGIGWRGSVLLWGGGSGGGGVGGAGGGSSHPVPSFPLRPGGSLLVSVVLATCFLCGGGGGGFVSVNFFATITSGLVVAADEHQCYVLLAPASVLPQHSFPYFGVGEFTKKVLRAKKIVRGLCRGTPAHPKAQPVVCVAGGGGEEGGGWVPRRYVGQTFFPTSPQHTPTMTPTVSGCERGCGHGHASGCGYVSGCGNLHGTHGLPSSALTAHTTCFCRPPQHPLDLALFAQHPSDLTHGTPAGAVNNGTLRLMSLGSSSSVAMLPCPALWIWTGLAVCWLC